MKKKLSKNYIAFTLTEMTMVLLIMSVIAAVSAPLVKHAVSDVTNNSVGMPTKFWGKVNGLAGIHNLNGDGGIVSIGAIPSGDPINYNNPALMIQANGKDNISEIAQIAMYGAGYHNNSKLAMDKYNNILFVRRQYEKIKEASNSIELGIMSASGVDKDTEINGSHIYIGANVASPAHPSGSDRPAPIYANRDIQIRSSLYNVGNALTNFHQDQISFNSDNAASSNGYGNIYIGRYSFRGASFSLDCNLGIGPRSNAIVTNRKEVSIGTYAGNMINDYVNGDGYNSADSVSIGKYANASINGPTERNGVVAIGFTALGPASMDTVYASGVTTNSVAIGSFTNYYITGRSREVVDSVSIGTYAGMYSSTRDISIGAYAGNFKKAAYQDVSDNIAIGFYAGFASGIPSDLIAIGNYAGAYSSAARHRIYIGTYAGYDSHALLAIGRYACANASSEGSSCIGHFPKEYIDSVGYYYVNDFEMLLYSHSGGRIFLVAKNIYAPGAINQISSDVRLKRKISLAPYSIKDFRKFNIYNFSLKYDKDHLKHIGVIAQEYRKAFPLAIVKGKKYLSIQPDWLYYSMINAVKDLDKLVQEFQVKLDEYVNNFESIKSRISTLEQSVAKEKQNNANMRKELEQINAQLLAKTKNNNKL